MSRIFGGVSRMHRASDRIVGMFGPVKPTSRIFLRYSEAPGQAGQAALISPVRRRECGPTLLDYKAGISGRLRLQQRRRDGRKSGTSDRAAGRGESVTRLRPGQDGLMTPA